MSGHEAERRVAAVTKDDIKSLAADGKQERADMMVDIDERFARQDKILALQNHALTRIEQALFAQDTHNEFQSRGVMTVMRRIDDHIDMVCKVGRWCLRTATTLLGITATLLVIIAKMKGWTL